MSHGYGHDLVNIQGSKNQFPRTPYQLQFLHGDLEIPGMASETIMHHSVGDLMFYPAIVDI